MHGSVWFQCERSRTESTVRGHSRGDYKCVITASEIKSTKDGKAGISN